MSPDESRRRCVVCRCVPLGRSVGSSVTGAEEEQGMDQRGWEGGDGTEDGKHPDGDPSVITLVH